MELDAIIGHPGLYPKPYAAHRNFSINSVPFMKHPWVCSVRENQNFFDNVQKKLAAPGE